MEIAIGAHSEEETEKSDFLSPEEVSDRISEFMTSQDLKKFGVALRAHTVKVSYRSFSDWQQDIMQEVFKRILEGANNPDKKNCGRKWPRHVPALTMFIRTASSIIDEMRNKTCAMSENRRSHVPSNIEQGSENDWLEEKSNQTAKLDAYRIAGVDEALDRFREAFADDEVAKDLLEAKYFAGFNPREIQELLGLTAVQYSSTLKRIDRKIATLRVK